MSTIKRFAKTAGTFLVGNVLSKLVAVFLLPIYTAYLSPSEYGTYDLVISILNLVMPIAFVQIWDGMYRFVFDCKNDAEKYRVVSNSLVVCVAGCLVFSALYACVAFFAGNWMSVEIWAYGLTLSLQYEASYIARSFFKNALFSASGVANALVAALLNIVLICHGGWGVESIYVSAAVGNMVQVLAIVFALRLPKFLSFSSFDKDLTFRMVKFSIPLCLASLSFWLFNGFTKVVISFLLGTADNGLYGVVSRFTAGVTMIASVFQFAWNEASYLMAGKQNRVSSYSLICNALLAALSLVAVLFPYVVRLVFPLFVAPEYSSAAALLPAATLGVMLNSYASFLATIFATEKMTRMVLLSTIGAAVVNVVATPLATMEFGLSGAVWSLALSYGILAFARLAGLKKLVDVQVGIKTLLPLASLPLACGAFYLDDAAISTAVVVVCSLFCGALAFKSLKDVRVINEEIDDGAR